MAGNLSRLATISSGSGSIHLEGEGGSIGQAAAATAKNGKSAVTLAIVKPPSPVFCSVTYFVRQSCPKLTGFPGKFTLAGDKLTAGGGAVDCNRTENVPSESLPVAASS